MSKDISCQVEGCLGHALLPGGSILEIDGKRMCWAHAAEAKKQKSKCVRVPLEELQMAYDLLTIALTKYSSAPMELDHGCKIIREMLSEKGIPKSALVMEEKIG